MALVQPLLGFLPLVMSRRYLQGFLSTPHFTGFLLVLLQLFVWRFSTPKQFQLLLREPNFLMIFKKLFFPQKLLHLKFWVVLFCLFWPVFKMWQ